MEGRRWAARYEWLSGENELIVLKVEYEHQNNSSVPTVLCTMAQELVHDLFQPWLWLVKLSEREVPGEVSIKCICPLSYVNILLLISGHVAQRG